MFLRKEQGIWWRFHFYAESLLLIVNLAECKNTLLLVLSLPGQLAFNLPWTEKQTRDTQEAKLFFLSKCHPVTLWNFDSILGGPQKVHWALLFSPCCCIMYHLDRSTVVIQLVCFQMLCSLRIVPQLKDHFWSDLYNIFLLFSSSMGGWQWNKHVNHRAFDSSQSWIVSLWEMNLGLN